MMKMHTHVLLLLLGVIATTHDEDQISFPFPATLETYLTYSPFIILHSLAHYAFILNNTLAFKLTYLNIIQR